MRANQLVDHHELAAMPEALHRVPRMQGTVLIIACDGMIIKRQSAISYSYSLVFALQIVPTDLEQVCKHFERIGHQANAAALAVLDHLHRNRSNRELALPCNEEHLHVKAEAANRQTPKNFFCRRGSKAFESTLRIRQTLEQDCLHHPGE